MRLNYILENLITILGAIINIVSRGEGVTPSYIDAYTCTHDLIIAGLFTLQKKMIRYGIFQIKVNICILICPINNYIFWGENHFIIPYFTYIADFFLIPQV